MPKKISQELRNQGLALFLGGMTLKKIAETLGVSMPTVAGWRHLDGWGIKRKSVRAQSQETILLQYRKKILENTTRHLDVSRMVSAIAAEYLSEFYKKNQREGVSEAERLSLLEIAERVAKICRVTAGIQNEIMPEAQEEAFTAASEASKAQLSPVPGAENG